MDLVEAIKNRKSIRDFKSEQVPQQVLREVLALAVRAPSAMNTQPWEFTVATGTVLESIKQGLADKFRAGEKPHPENPVIGWPAESIYRHRQIGLAKQLFQLMDIAREDAEKRGQWLERGFRFYNAPAAIIISVDRLLISGTPIFDIGGVTQTLCLAALHFGLGTCIEDQGVRFPEVLRQHCGIPLAKQIVIAVAIGYPNWDFPANRFESTRESIDAFTTWYGY